METENWQADLIFEQGTAYDFFVSLHVLHHPSHFGLRASWAAGVRSRLTNENRQTLELAQDLVYTPLRWIYSLPPPRDGQTVLYALENLPEDKRLHVLSRHSLLEPAAEQVLHAVAAHQAWDQNDVDALRAAHPHPRLSQKELVHILDGWAQPAAFGRLYLQALQNYYDVFFIEEEKRIRPALRAALEQATRLAQESSLPALLEQLSQGVVFSEWKGLQEIVLTPSYWSTPFVIYDWVAPGCLQFLFGARPSEEALVPGETVPDAMLQALKALADPTRLRILRYLSEEAQTPSALARRLRLRPPTVLHHLNALRLAGLVHLNIEPEDERRYAIRREAVAATFDRLDGFLSQEEGDT